MIPVAPDGAIKLTEVGSIVSPVVSFASTLITVEVAP